MERFALTPDFLRADADGAGVSARQAGRLVVVRVTSDIDAVPARVFDAWLDPAIAGQWLFATASRPMTRVAIAARPRGRFSFVDPEDGFEHTGFYAEIDRPRRLALSLGAGRRLPATRVLAEVAPRSVGGAAELTVTHSGVPVEHAARIEARWTGMLYGLGLLLRGT